MGISEFAIRDLQFPIVRLGERQTFDVMYVSVTGSRVECAGSAQLSKPEINVIRDGRAFRVEPELRAAILSVVVRVPRLAEVVRLEIEAIRSHSQESSAS